MNNSHLEQIIKNYIEKFEYINSSIHQEYYKWSIAKSFKPLMDGALSSSAGDFPEALKGVKKLTNNIIDNYTQPLQGLIKISEEDPQAVKDMFQELYSGDDTNLEDKQKRIGTFLDKSYALREKHYPDSYLYKDDMHSVTGYLFLYNPDQNYLYKATHAQRFADCVEFLEDWGSGTNVKLDVYYRMCDQLVEKMKANDALMKTDASRFEDGWGPDPNKFHPDTQKHILAFDLIYCCSTYGLFEGIDFERLNTKDKIILLEKRRKAKEYLHEWTAIRHDADELEKAYTYLNSVYDYGNSVIYKNGEKGIVIENNGRYITVEFGNGDTKKLGTALSALKGFITSEEKGYAEKMDRYRTILNSEERIRSNLKAKEKKLAEYADYID